MGSTPLITHEQPSKKAASFYGFMKAAKEECLQLGRLLIYCTFQYRSLSSFIPRGPKQ